MYKASTHAKCFINNNIIRALQGYVLYLLQGKPPGYCMMRGRRAIALKGVYVAVTKGWEGLD